MTSGQGREDLTRYNYCIYADQEVVVAVMDGDPPGTVTLELTSFAKVLDMSWDESRYGSCHRLRYVSDEMH